MSKWPSKPGFLAQKLKLHMFDATTRLGLSDLVYAELKERIFESRYRPGEKLPVDEITRELGVSRQPVMDAMKRMEVEGLISIVPQVGCKVRQYPANEIHDFYRLFAAAEALMARRAAERVTRADMALLKAISAEIRSVGKGRKASPEAPARNYRALNRKLHSEIRRISASASLSEMVETMADRSDLFIASSGRPMLAETLRTAQSEHDDVLHAIAEHDGEGAAAAMFHHVLETNVRLQAFLQPKASTGA